VFPAVYRWLGTSLVHRQRVRVRPRRSDLDHATAAEIVAGDAGRREEGWDARWRTHPPRARRIRVRHLPRHPPVAPRARAMSDARRTGKPAPGTALSDTLSGGTLRVLGRAFPDAAASRRARPRPNRGRGSVGRNERFRTPPGEVGGAGLRGLSPRSSPSPRTSSAARSGRARPRGRVGCALLARARPGGDYRGPNAPISATPHPVSET
jgi:hypothetical protein